MRSSIARGGIWTSWPPPSGERAGDVDAASCVRRYRLSGSAAARLERPGAGCCSTPVQLLGLPEPGLNVDLHDESGWVACVDFLWPGPRVVAEYYGSVHGPTWRADLARAALVEDTGHSVVVITDEDLTSRQVALRQRLERLLVGL